MADYQVTVDAYLNAITGNAEAQINKVTRDRTVKAKVEVDPKMKQAVGEMIAKGTTEGAKAGAAALTGLQKQLESQKKLIQGNIKSLEKSLGSVGMKGGLAGAEDVRKQIDTLTARAKVLQNGIKDIRSALAGDTSKMSTERFDALSRYVMAERAMQAQLRADQAATTRAQKAASAEAIAGLKAQGNAAIDAAKKIDEAIRPVYGKQAAERQIAQIAAAGKAERAEIGKTEDTKLASIAAQEKAQIRSAERVARVVEKAETAAAKGVARVRQALGLGTTKAEPVQTAQPKATTTTTTTAGATPATTNKTTTTTTATPTATPSVNAKNASVTAGTVIVNGNQAGGKTTGGAGALPAGSIGGITPAMAGEIAKNIAATIKTTAGTTGGNIKSLAGGAGGAPAAARAIETVNAALKGVQIQAGDTAKGIRLRATYSIKQLGAAVGDLVNANGTGNNNAGGIIGGIASSIAAIAKAGASGAVTGAAKAVATVATTLAILGASPKATNTAPAAGSSYTARDRVIGVSGTGSNVVTTGMAGGPTMYWVNQPKGSQTTASITGGGVPYYVDKNGNLVVPAGGGYIGGVPALPVGTTGTPYRNGQRVNKPFQYTNQNPNILPSGTKPIALDAGSNTYYASMNTRAYLPVPVTPSGSGGLGGASGSTSGWSSFFQRVMQSLFKSSGTKTTFQQAAKMFGTAASQAFQSKAQQVGKQIGNYLYNNLTNEQQQAWQQRAYRQYQSVATNKNGNPIMDKKGNIRFTYADNPYYGVGGTSKAVGNAIKNIGGRITDSGNAQMSKFYNNSMIFGYMKKFLSSMYTNMKAFDDQVRVYRKLLPDWDQKDMTSYLTGLGTSGQRLGKTTSEMTEASMLMTRSGYGGETKQLQSLNKELTTSAVLLSNVADEEMSVSDAADSIVAVGKAWNVSDDELSAFASHYVDAVNEISNHMAVTSNDLTENISKTSSAMAVGGNTLDQTLAMMTAMTELNRNAAKSATALRTLQSRHTQIVQEGSTTGQYLASFYDRVGIAYTDAEGQLRSFYDVWSDLASKDEETGKSIWETLDADEQKMFLLKAAGANRSSEAAALLINWQNVDKAMELAANSAGSALESNDVMLDSVTGKTQLLAAAWENFSVQAMKSGAVKAVIGGLANAVTALNNPLTRNVALWGSVAIAGAAAYSMFKGIALLSIGTVVSDLGAVITTIGPTIAAYAEVYAIPALQSIATAAAALGPALIPVAAAGAASFLLLRDAVQDTAKQMDNVRNHTEVLNDLDVANDRVQKFRNELDDLTKDLKKSGLTDEEIEVNVDVKLKTADIAMAEDVRNQIGAEYFNELYSTNSGGSPYSAVELANRENQPSWVKNAVVQSRMQADQGGIAGVNLEKEGLTLLGDLATEQERYNKAVSAYGQSSTEAASCQERVNNAMEPAQDYFHDMQDALQEINPDLDTYSEQLKYLQDYAPEKVDLFEGLATQVGEADDAANSLARDFDAVADAASEAAGGVEDMSAACATLAGSVGALSTGAEGIASIKDVWTDLFGGTDQYGNAIVGDGKLDWSSISALYQNFGSLEGFDEEGGYLDTLLGGYDITAAQQQQVIMEMMHNKVLELTGGYEGLASVDERVLTAFLDQTGITNSAATAQEWLAEATEKTNEELERQMAALNSQTGAQKAATEEAEKAATQGDALEAYNAGDNLALTDVLKNAGIATDTEINVDKFAELAGAMGLSADEASQLLENLQALNGWKLVDNSGQVLDLAAAFDTVKASIEPVRAAIESLPETFSSAFASIGEAMSSAFDGIHSFFETIFNGISTFSQALQTFMSGDYESAYQMIGDAWENFVWGDEGKPEVTVDVEADTEGAEADIESLGEDNEVTVPVKYETDTNGVNLEGFSAGEGPVIPVKADTSQAEGEIAGLDGETVTVDVEADTSGLSGATDGLDGGEITVPIVPQLDSSALNPVDILKMGQGPISIPISADPSEAEGAISEVSSGLSGLEGQGAHPMISARDSASGVISSVSGALASLDGRSATVHINVVKTGSTDVELAKGGVVRKPGAFTGERHAKGGHKKDNTVGTWLGDEYNGSGERKPELVVTPDGNAHLAGLSGWEYEQLPVGTKVYSNAQTKQMLGDKYKKAYNGKRRKDGTEGKRLAAGTGSNGIITWNIGNTADDSDLLLANIKSIDDYIEDIKDNISDINDKYKALVSTIDDEITLESYAEELYDGVSDLHKELLEQKEAILEKQKEELEAASATVENSDDYRTVLEDILKVKKEIVDQDIAALDHEKDQLENQIKLLGTVGNIAGRAQGGIGQKGATMLPEDYANTMIEMYKKEQEIFHKQAEIYRANMYAEESEEIQDLQTSWWQTQDKIIDIIQDLADTVAEEFSTVKSNYDAAADYTTWFYQDWKEKLDIQVDYMQDQYDKQTKILNKQDTAIERQKQIQDAEADLVKAQKKRTMVMDENGNWTWKSDTQSVLEATKSLNDVKDSIAKEIRDEKREQDLEDEKNAAYAAYYGTNPITNEYVTTQAEADYLRTTNDSYNSIYAQLKALEENADFNGQMLNKAQYEAIYGGLTAIEALEKQASKSELQESTRRTIDEEAANILKEYGIVAEKDAEGNVNIQQGINELSAMTDANGKLSIEKQDAIKTLNELRNAKIDTTNSKFESINGTLGEGSGVIAQGILDSAGKVSDEVAGIKKDDSTNKLYLAVKRTADNIEDQEFDVKLDDTEFNASVNNFNVALNNYSTSTGQFSDAVNKFSTAQNTTPQYVTDFKKAVEGAQSVVESGVTTSENYEKYLMSTAVADANELVKTTGKSGAYLDYDNGRANFQYYINWYQKKIDSGKLDADTTTQYQSIVDQLTLLQKAYTEAKNGDVYGASQAITNSEYSKIYEAITGKKSAIYDAIHDITDNQGNLLTATNNNSEKLLNRLKNIDTTVANGGTLSETVNTDAIEIARRYKDVRDNILDYTDSNGQLNIQAVMDYLKTTYYTGGKHENKWETTQQASDYTALAGLRQIKLAVQDDNVEAAIALMNGDVGNAIVTNFGVTSQTFSYLSNLQKLDTISTNIETTKKALTEDSSKLLSSISNVSASSITADDMKNIMTRINMDAGSIAARYGISVKQLVDSKGNVNIQAVMDKIKSEHYSNGKFDSNQAYSDYLALTVLRKAKLAVKDGDAATLLSNVQAGTDALYQSIGGKSSVVSYLSNINSESNTIKKSLTSINSESNTIKNSLTSNGSVGSAISDMVESLSNIDSNTYDQISALKAINMDAGSIAARYGMSGKQLVDSEGNVNIQAIIDKIKSEHYSNGKFDSNQAYSDYLALTVLRNAKLAVKDGDAATLLSNVQAGTDALYQSTGGKSSVVSYLSNIISESNTIKNSLSNINSESNTIKNSLTSNGSVGSKISDMVESLSNIDSNTYDQISALSALKAINMDAGSIAARYGISGRQLVDSEGNVNIQAVIDKIQSEHYSNGKFDSNQAYSDYLALKVLRNAKLAVKDGDAATLLSNVQAGTDALYQSTGGKSSVVSYLSNIISESNTIKNSLTSNGSVSSAIKNSLTSNGSVGSAISDMVESLSNIDSNTYNQISALKAINMDAGSIAARYGISGRQLVDSEGNVNIQAVIDKIQSEHYSNGKFDSNQAYSDYLALKVLRNAKLAVKDGDAATLLSNVQAGTDALYQSTGGKSSVVSYLSNINSESNTIKSSLNSINSESNTIKNSLTSKISDMVESLSNIDSNTYDQISALSALKAINMDAGSIAARYGISGRQLVDSEGNVNIQTVIDKIMSEHYSNGKFDSNQAYSDYLALKVLRNAKLAVKDGDAATLLSNVQAGTDALYQSTGGKSSVVSYLSGINSESNTIKNSLTSNGSVGSAISDMVESLSNIDSNTYDQISALKAINADAGSIANGYGIQLESDAEGNVNLLALANAIKESHYTSKSGWDSDTAQADYNTVLALRSMKIAVQDDNLAQLVGLMQADTGGILSNLGSSGSTFKYLASINKNTGIEAGTIKDTPVASQLVSVKESIDTLMSRYASNYNTLMLNGQITSGAKAFRIYENDSGAYSVDYAIEQLKSLSYVDQIATGAEEIIEQLEAYKQQMETLGFSTSYNVLDSYKKYSTGNQYSSAGKFVDVDPDYLIQASAWTSQGYTAKSASSSDHVSVEDKDSFDKMINAAAKAYSVTLDESATQLEKVQTIFEEVAGTDFSLEGIYNYLQKLSTVTTEEEYTQIATMQSLINTLTTANTAAKGTALSESQSDVLKWLQSMGAEIHGMYTAEQAQAMWSTGGQSFVDLVNNMFGTEFTKVNDAKKYFGSSQDTFMKMFNAANTTNTKGAQSIKYGDYTIVIENVQATNADELLESLQNLSYKTLQRGMTSIGLKTDYNQ